MVIPLSQAFVGDRPIESMFDAETLKGPGRAGTGVGWRGSQVAAKGSAYFSPAESEP